MGSFDLIHVRCTGCRKSFAVQSKAGSCRFKNYSIDNAPMAIVASLVERSKLDDNADFKCPRCGIFVQVKAAFIVQVVEHVKVPTIVDDDPG